MNLITAITAPIIAFVIIAGCITARYIDVPCADFGASLFSRYTAEQYPEVQR